MLTIKFDRTLEGDAGQQALDSLSEYTKHIQQVASGSKYDSDESSVLLPGDVSKIKAAQDAAQKKGGPDLRYHFVIGIGGSNLGTKAVYDALFGHADIFEPARYPKMLFAETTDPEWLAAAGKLLGSVDNPNQVLFSLISKSGGTTETMANFEILMQHCPALKTSWQSRVVAITDAGSPLWDAAAKIGVDCLEIPKKVGGRYSVMSNVGLFPLATVGVDVRALCQGALEMRDACLAGEDNHAARSAALLAYYKHKGKTINDNMFFHPELESLGKWYRQLMGESIGKANTLDGSEVFEGITPTVSLGSTDLHSVGQLYLGGPRDKFTTFVHTQGVSSISVPQNRLFPGLVPMLDGKPASNIMQAIYDGVTIAYKKAGLPFAEVLFDKIDANDIGAYMQFKMLEMMYLGKLLNVNPFDQPSVEDYKVETKKILSA